MRVTQNNTLANMLFELNKNRANYSSLSKELATQKRVSSPSDDALAFGSSEEKKSQVKLNEQFQSNLDNGIEQARMVDDSIGRMLEHLYDLKTLSTKGANGDVLTDSDMEALADNVASVRQKLVDLGNSQANGRYIFGGTKTQTAAFTLSGTNVTYNGNQQDLVIQANQSSAVPISINGNSLFDYNGESAFDLLNRIETAMRSQDAAAVNAELGNVDKLVEHLGRTGGNIGNAINKMEYAYEHYEATNINLASQISRLVDTDYAETASRIQSLDVAYSAALAITSRMSQLSLLNYI